MMGMEIQRSNDVRVRFGTLPIQEITRHDIEALRVAHIERRIVTLTDVKGRQYQVRRGGVVGVHRCLGRLRAFFGWAVDKDHVISSPFKKGGIAVRGLFAHEGERARRLEPGEEERLLNAANPHLRAVLIAALETACRIGELLSLQWRQVRFDLNEIHFRAVNTKARRARHLPMSQRLRAVIEMRRHDRDGREYPASAFVFGDASGAQIKSVKTAWQNARLKAHGYEVKREKNARLTPECRRQLAEINLHFHDLRREAGSRLLDAGMPLGAIQAFLDHANISTTSRYLKVTQHGLHVAMKQYEKTRSRGTTVAHGAQSEALAAQQPAGKSLH
jgi:integrase